MAQEVEGATYPHVARMLRSAKCLKLLLCNMLRYMLRYTATPPLRGVVLRCCGQRVVEEFKQIFSRRR